MKGFARELIGCKDFCSIVSEAKWLSSEKFWLKYRRQIVVTEQSGSNLIDHQILIELNSSNFDFSHVNNDGSDIRFSDAFPYWAGNVYPYWIEKWDSINQEAKIWVKVPNIPANGTTSFYMYYGNSNVASASDGEGTFEFFDDFEDGNIDSSKWTYIRGTWEETDGYVHVIADPDGAPGSILRSNYSSGSYIARAKIKLPDPIECDGTLIIHEQGDNTAYLSINGVKDDTIKLGKYEWDGSSWFGDAGILHSYNPGDIIVEEVYVNGNNIKIYDRTNGVSYSWTSSYSSGYFGLHQGNGSTTSALFYWVLVRKYVDPEPSVSIGNEETP